MSSAYAVAGAANDAMNSEEAEAVVAAARSAGSRSCGWRRSSGRLPCPPHTPWHGAANDAMNNEEAEAMAEAARSAGSAAWTAGGRDQST